jgi:hypothetical protein
VQTTLRHFTQGWKLILLQYVEVRLAEKLWSRLKLRGKINTTEFCDWHYLQVTWENGEERIVLRRNGCHCTVIRTLKICADLSCCLEQMQEKISKTVLNWFPPGRASKRSRRWNKRDACKCKRLISNILWEIESVWEPDTRTVKKIFNWKPLT